MRNPIAFLKHALSSFYQNTIMLNVLPPQFQALFRYDERWQVLLCRQHEVAIPMDQLAKHLRVDHSVYLKEAKMLLDFMSNISYCHNKKELPRPYNNSIPIIDIPILKGY